MKRFLIFPALVIFLAASAAVLAQEAPVTAEPPTGQEGVEEAPAEEEPSAAPAAIEAPGATDAGEMQARLFESYERLARVMEIVQSRYVQPVESDKLFEGALDGIMASLDPYSSYIPPEMYEDFVEETEQQFSGIGISIGVENDRIKVLSVLEGMPAFRAGVHPEDLIVSVDGQPVGEIGDLGEVTARLRGAKGTQVEVTFFRPSTDEQFTVTLTREDIPVASLRGYSADASTGKWDFMLDDKLKIGYIRITKFAQNTPEELDEAYRGLTERGLRGLIIDLRNNAGGLLDSAVAVVDRFIDQGLIVRTQGRAGVHSESYATPYNTYDPPLPLVLLVNSYSASASEVMGGALQDHARAVLVGTRTFGKGSVQNVVPLDGHGALRLTVAYYYTPAGRLVHRVEGAENWGLDPDVVQKMSVEQAMALRREWMAVAGGSSPQSLGEGGREVLDVQLARAVDILRGGLLMAAMTGGEAR